MADRGQYKSLYWGV